MAAWPDHGRAVAGATGWLADTGVRAGDRLVTLLRNDEDAFALGLACMLAGALPALRQDRSSTRAPEESP